MMERRAVYLCRGDRKNTYLVFFVFLALGFLGFFLAGVGVASPLVGQGIAFISLIVAAYIFIRYIATLYRYEIITEEEGDFLLIIRVQGKKDFTQKKLPMTELSAIIEIKNDPNVPKEHPDLPVINYSSHLMADTYFLLHFAGEEPVLLRVNVEEEFLSALTAYLPADENTPKEEHLDDEC